MMYKTMRLFYFGNEQQKSDVYFQLILPLLSKYLKACSYFVKRDWNGGPNYKIFFENQVFDQGALHREYLESIKNDYPVSEEELTKNISSYQQLGSVIGEIERAETDTVDRDNHLKLVMTDLDLMQVKKLYNSQGHLDLQFRSLMKLQAFVNQYSKEINSIPVAERYVLFMQLMLQVLSYSKLGDKYSMIVYLSNSEGILAIAQGYGKREGMMAKFDLLYDALPLKTLRFPEKRGADILDYWQKLFNQINEEIDTYIQTNELYTDGYYSKEDQHKHLQQNIGNINSEFHNQALMNNHSDVTAHKVHQQFRFLINIEYQVMHMLGITFKEKAFLCHALPRFIMEETGSSWQEILSERRVTIET